MNEKALNAQTQAAMTEAWAMARIGDFKETVAARVQDDLTFAQALLGKAITLFVNRGGSRRITGGIWRVWLRSAGADQALLHRHRPELRLQRQHLPVHASGGDEIRHQVLVGSLGRHGSVSRFEPYGDVASRVFSHVDARRALDSNVGISSSGYVTRFDNFKYPGPRPSLRHRCRVFGLRPQRLAERHQALDELVAQAQELKMRYE